MSIVRKTPLLCIFAAISCILVNAADSVAESGTEAGEVMPKIINEADVLVASFSSVPSPQATPDWNILGSSGGGGGGRGGGGGGGGRSSSSSSGSSSSSSGGSKGSTGKSSTGQVVGGTGGTVIGSGRYGNGNGDSGGAQKAVPGAGAAAVLVLGCAMLCLV